MKLPGIFLFSLAFTVYATASIPDSLALPPSSHTSPKSPLIAYGLALGGTFIPVAIGTGLLFKRAADKKNDDQLAVSDSPYDKSMPAIVILTGWIIGPSLGQFYAGSPGQGSLGILIRGIPTVLVAASLANNDDDLQNGLIEITLASACVIGGSIYSFIDTKFAVRRYNKSQEQHWGFAPEFFPSSNGGLTPGMLAWTRF